MSERLEGTDAYVVRGVLTRAQCVEWIAMATKSGFARSGGRTFFAGNRERAIVTSEIMAAQLWSALAPHVAPHVHDEASGDFSFSGRLASVPSGVYDPVGAADLLRFSRYAPGGNFSAHRDTCYARDQGYVGFLTVLVFLGDGDLTGGETVVYRTDRADCEQVVHPEPGKALVFYHHRRHRGMEVTGGTKHIVRTEIMFSRRAER